MRALGLILLLGAMVHAAASGHGSAPETRLDASSTANASGIESDVSLPVSYRVSSRSETVASIVLAEFGILGLSALTATGAGFFIAPLAAFNMGAEEFMGGNNPDARWRWKPFLLTLGIGTAFSAYPFLRFGTGYRGPKDDRFLQATFETFGLMNVGFWSWVLVSESGRNSGIAVFPAPGGGAGVSRTWNF